MKKAIFYTVMFVVHFTLSGCNAQNIVNSYNNLSVRLAGNTPPTFFKVDSIEETNDLKLMSKHFTALMPMVREKDFKDMGGWHGSFHGKDLTTLYLYKFGFYHLEFTSSTYPYTDRERAIENKINNFPSQRTKSNGEIIDVNLHYETHGKEKYICLINESYNVKLGERKKHYGCYKFNPERTAVKKISIDLTYTRVPNLPEELEALANEYTYEDLQKRLQRILDSLYIKDGWEK